MVSLFVPPNSDAAPATKNGRARPSRVVDTVRSDGHWRQAQYFFVSDTKVRFWESIADFRSIRVLSNNLIRIYYNLLALAGRSLLLCAVFLDALSTRQTWWLKTTTSPVSSQIVTSRSNRPLRILFACVRTKRKSTPSSGSAFFMSIFKSTVGYQNFAKLLFPVLGSATTLCFTAYGSWLMKSAVCDQREEGTVASSIQCPWPPRITE